MTHDFTSLRHPLEKLLEAEHFLARLTMSHGLEFQFELNAFLSASRSVTFLLQKAMHRVPGFAEWYGERQARMKADNAMRFFIELRNISQKQGPVSYVGGGIGRGRWTYRFVGRPQPVPSELIGRDIGHCCGIHLTKLAVVIADCADAFPFHACPAHAFTEEGMATLGYGWDDVETAVGLPPGYTNVPGIPAGERLRLLSREIEPLDRDTIERLASGQIGNADGVLEFPTSAGGDLVDDLASMAGVGGAGAPRDMFLSAIMKRIDDIERSGGGS